MSNKSTDKKKEQRNYFHTASKGKYVINVGSDFVNGCVKTLEGGRVTEGYRRKKKKGGRDCSKESETGTRKQEMRDGGRNDVRAMKCCTSDLRQQSGAARRCDVWLLPLQEKQACPLHCILRRVGGGGGVLLFTRYLTRQTHTGATETSEHKTRREDAEGGGKGAKLNPGRI